MIRSSICQNWCSFDVLKWEDFLIGEQGRKSPKITGTVQGFGGPNFLKLFFVTKIHFELFSID